LSGIIFDSAMPPCPSSISSSPTPSNVTIPDAAPLLPLPRYKVSPCRQSLSLRC
jgi:hypothetical protein